MVMDQGRKKGLGSSDGVGAEGSAAGMESWCYSVQKSMTTLRPHGIKVDWWHLVWGKSYVPSRHGRRSSISAYLIRGHVVERMNSARCLHNGEPLPLLINLSS
ncbi:hypothetical protein ACH5RR_012688 [Cinchona calisaya]|uniref:Uncharacterized protein n=1 Tax=Cinchona calisaya TaxID=153742 RepID=A0ABD3AC16_9GENT